MGNELSKYVMDQIKADAKMRTGYDENEDHKPYDKGMYHGFVSGAAIYTDKAQGLVDALEQIAKEANNSPEDSWGEIAVRMKRIAIIQLQQFKDGKGVGDESTKALLNLPDDNSPKGMPLPAEDPFKK